MATQSMRSRLENGEAQSVVAVSQMLIVPSRSVTRIGTSCLKSAGSERQRDGVHNLGLFLGCVRELSGRTRHGGKT